MLMAKDKTRVVGFILSSSGILDSLEKRFDSNKEMTFEEKSETMRITCNFIRELIDDYSRYQGHTWFIGSNYISASDNLVIYENVVINMSIIESHIDLLNTRLELEFNHKYELEILL